MAQRAGHVRLRVVSASRVLSRRQAGERATTDPRKCPMSRGHKHT